MIHPVDVYKRQRLYHGRGISTDIVKSSVNAYINAVNSVFLAMELEQQEEE